MSSPLSLVRPELVALAPVLPSRASLSGTAQVCRERTARLHANENTEPFAIDEGRYPDADAVDAETALATICDVPKERVLATRGSDEGIDLLVRATCAAGRDAVLTFPPTFSMYAHAARVQGAALVERPTPFPDLTSNGDMLPSTPVDRVKLIFLCSPNNPTGASVAREQIERLVACHSGRALVVIDEAYIEFSLQPSVCSWVERLPNLAVLRTLSKAHGFASARVGCVVAHPELISVLRRIRPPYALPTASIQAAVNAASPVRRRVVAQGVASIRSERQRVYGALKASPAVARVWESDGNFHLVQMRDPARFAQGVAQKNILVRDFRMTPGLEDCFRLTVGTPAQNDGMLACLESE